MNSLICRIWNKITHRNIEQIGGCQRGGLGIYKISKCGQNTQTSGYKINNPQGCNVQCVCFLSSKSSTGGFSVSEHSSIIWELE